MENKLKVIVLQTVIAQPDIICPFARISEECLKEGIRSFGKPTSVIYDIKYVLPADAVDDRL